MQILTVTASLQTLTLRSSVRLMTASRRTTEAPRRQHGRRGEIPDRAERSVWLADTDALFAATVQSFLPLGRLFSL